MFSTEFEKTAAPAASGIATAVKAVKGAATTAGKFIKKNPLKSAAAAGGLGLAAGAAMGGSKQAAQPVVNNNMLG